MSITIVEFLADQIQHIFERPTMYGSAAQIENCLRISFRFAAALSNCEDRLDLETTKIAMRLGYVRGGFAEGYYQDHCDARDSLVRNFILDQFRSLADALPLRLPPRSGNSFELPSALVGRKSSFTTFLDNEAAARAASAVARWVRASLEQICADPSSSRSAYDLEDELCGLPWVWGIVTGEAPSVKEQQQRIREAHSCDTTIAWQFFRQRPWATSDEGKRFVFAVYEQLVHSTLADERIHRA